MNLTGLHILLTYKCNLSCDHCFIWGSPHKHGLMSLADIQLVLQQASEVGSIRTVFFEGGEPFLYYSLLLDAVKEASSLGFKVGIVTNAFWARNPDRALSLLRPFAGLVQELCISDDLYHWNDLLRRRAVNAIQAAGELGIPCGSISIAQPEQAAAAHPAGQRPIGETGVMYRGRAAEKLAGRATQQPWENFNACMYEDLISPERLHLDPEGNLLHCEGINLGNIHEQSLQEIIAQYDPCSHPVLGPVVAGGPAELVRRYDLEHEPAYADACHLCYEARKTLRSRFPDILAPAHVYQEIAA